MDTLYYTNPQENGKGGNWTYTTFWNTVLKNNVLEHCSGTLFFERITVL